MYFEDLTQYRGFSSHCVDNAVNVGWLDHRQKFAKGIAPRGFLKKLRQLSENPKNRARGFHHCKLGLLFWCIWRMGNGEIHVIGADGTTYIAPVMIVHYISAHWYLPPKQFIDAVLRSDC